MAGFDNDCMYADNADFSVSGGGSGSAANGLATNGQLWIGTTAVNAGGTHINVGTLTSPGGTVTIGYSSPNITIDLTGGGTAVEHLTGNTGGQLNPDGANNFNTLGTGSITIAGAGSTLTTQLTGLTNHAVLVGAGTATITKLTVGTNGQVLIGASAADPAFATLTSSDSSITFTTGANSLSLQVAGGTTVLKTLTGDTGGAISPTAGNINTLGSGSITIAGTGSTLTTQLTGLTNHAVLVGAGTTTITKVGPTATAGQVLQSAGAAADPAFSTATYPSTTTINQILYSSATNTVTGITAANSASLVSSSAGVPSWATMTSGQLIIGNTGGTPTAALPTSTGGNYIAGAGTLKYIPANYIPGCSNIGIAYSSPTFTVQGYDGTALSTTNPGYVTLQSKANPGRFVTITITANQTFTDGTTGTTDNARFGVTTGVNWAQDIPFFLYGVMDDTEALINFMISRNPCATVSPASTSISKTGAIINVNQADFFSLDNITVTSYDSNPCKCLGSFRMQFSGATDSWTVQALNINDGIGNFNDNIVFSFPSGQNGAAAGTYILSNAGTEPVWTTNGMVYSIQRNGLVKYNFDATNASTAGVGANVLQPVLPYALSSSNQEAANMFVLTTPTVLLGQVAITSSASNVNSMTVHNNGTSLLNSSILLTYSLQFTMIYRAFKNTGL